jgi:arylsulfatase A-like enzyme
MPFLDQLAREGLYCAQANAVYPDSIEGQVALFCGQPPIPDGEPGDYQQQSQRALPRVLRAHGYGSALFHAGRFAFLGMRDVVGPFGFDCLADAATIGGTAGSSFGIDEEATVDALLQWIAARPRTEPFLCCYLPIAGHHPYASPPGGPFDPTTQLGCYKNALRYADRALQRLHAGLCRLRAPEELLLCVVGDHGQAFGEHPGNFGHSLEVYEENLRVPLLFWAPGTALGGARTDAVCSHLDLVPTLLDLLGLDLLGLEPAARAGAPGRSLLRLPLRGGRVQAFTDWGELLLAARDGDWKYVLEATTGRERLFDLGKDPGEQRNVVGAHPQLAMALRRDALEFARAAR